MKRFRWPLQRLLDVTMQRELARRAELLRLGRETARVRQEIASRRRVIRASLKELARQALAERMGQQEIVLACSAGREREIRRFQDRLEALAGERKRTVEELVRVRGARETLEKMRDEARWRHVQEQLKLEQKALDEVAHVAFAHRALQAPTAPAAAGG